MRHTYKLTLAVLFTLSIVLLSCTIKHNNDAVIAQSPKENPVSEAVEKNNQAIKLYMQYRRNNDSLQVAIGYLNEAIAIDSTYLLAYVNKAQIQCQIGDATGAINTINIVCMKEPNNRYYLTAKGLLQDIAGQKKEAQNSYKQALNIYNQLIKEYPDSSALYLDKYFVLHFVVEDPLILKDSINYYKRKFSDNNDFIWKGLEGFDKKKYLQEMTNNKL